MDEDKPVLYSIEKGTEVSSCIASHLQSPLCNPQADHDESDDRLINDNVRPFCQVVHPLNAWCVCMTLACKVHMEARIMCQSGHCPRGMLITLHGKMHDAAQWKVVSSEPRFVQHTA